MAQELKRLNQFGNFDNFGGFYDADKVDTVLAEKDAENRRLKRALWLARAERATAKQAYYDVLSRGISSERVEMYDVWNNVERKCRAKAEQYK